MADAKLTALAAATPAVGDYAYIAKGGVSKKALIEALVKAGLIQPAAAAGAGDDLTIQAAAATGGNTDGGDVVLVGGAGAGTGVGGRIMFIPSPAAYGIYVIDKGGGITRIQEAEHGVGDGGWIDFSNSLTMGRGPSKVFEVNSGYAVMIYGAALGFAPAGVHDPDTYLYRPATGVIQATRDPGGANMGTFSSVPNRVAMSGDLTDYNHFNNYFLDLDPNGANRNVHSLNAGVDGQMMVITHTGSANNLTIKHQSATGTAAQRILNTTGADIVLTANQLVSLRYDLNLARWRAW